MYSITVHTITHDFIHFWHLSHHKCLKSPTVQSRSRRISDTFHCSHRLDFAFLATLLLFHHWIPRSLIKIIDWKLHLEYLAAGVAIEKLTYLSNAKNTHCWCLASGAKNPKISLGGVVRKLIAHLSLWHSWAHPTQQSVAAMVKTAIPITSSDVFFKVETLLFQSA